MRGQLVVRFYSRNKDEWMLFGIFEDTGFRFRGEPWFEGEPPRGGWLRTAPVVRATGFALGVLGFMALVTVLAWSHPLWLIPVVMAATVYLVRHVLLSMFVEGFVRAFGW